MKVIYVDNNATTMVAPEVLDAMLPYFSTNYGNPSSMHSFGGNVAGAINEARDNVAKLIGAQPEEVVFTSCGTESDGTAIRAAIESYPDKKHIVTSRVEHPAVKNLYETLSKKGYRATFVPVDPSGRLDIDYLYDSLNDDTAIVSLMWGNNETGVIFPIEEISQEVKSRGILFHTDAVQAVSKIPINIGETGVDMLSLSGHKFHSPKGIGALYIRKGTKFSPFMIGFMIGGHQESGRRGGTENTASIIGLGKAAELAAAHLVENGYERISRLRDRLEQTLLAKVSNALINGDPTNRLPNTTSVAFEYVEGEAILLMMNEHGICASSGSACTSGSLEPSHVLRAMGVPFTAAHGSIRLKSFN
jgi:cysteine desulfurase